MSRPDAVDKVTGRAMFTSDLALPRMAVGKLLTSPFPHARLRGIDTRAARALPGVLAVVTAGDLPDVNLYFGDIVQEQPALAVDKVRHVGEAVAAVAAVDAATAEEAIQQIQVDYEDLPAVDTLDAALAPGAALVHEQLPDDTVTDYVAHTNVLHSVCEEKGDVERGFAEADRIFEDNFVFPRVYHFPMEPSAVVAQANSSAITVWSITQTPFGLRRKLAAAFHLPVEQVRVVTPYIGGSFGGRGKGLEIIAVALARSAGVPVKLVLSLYEDMMMIRRAAVRARLKTGVRLDGTILAREASFDLDCGAYSMRSAWITEMAIARFLAAYRTPNYRVSGRCVYTNTSPSSTYRSPGMQLVWMRETQFDRVARELDMDPVEFRRRNFQKRGESGIQAGVRPADADLASDLDKVASAIGWEGARAPGRYRGIACYMSAASAGPPSSASARLHSDGTLSIVMAGIEMGQGIHDAMAHVASLELGVPVERVRVVPIADTAYMPYDTGSAGSRGTVMSGLAVQLAVRDIRQQLLQMASDMLDKPVEMLDIRDGLIVDGQNKQPISRVLEWFYTPKANARPDQDALGVYSKVQRASHRSGAGDVIGRAIIGPDFEGGRLNLKPTFWEVAMGAVEIEIDRQTGLIKPVRYVALAEPGKILSNAIVAQGQVVGAAVQGLGHTLSEELIFQDGLPLNRTLMEYRPPKSRDVPLSCECIMVENGDGPGPFGAKGMGQGGISPVAPAITAAVAQATGVYFHELPLTPERVWRALASQPEHVPGGTTT
jgi:CO/xanthine dehydrogenase Mo-binding subunit